VTCPSELDVSSAPPVLQAKTCVKPAIANAKAENLKNEGAWSMAPDWPKAQEPVNKSSRAGAADARLDRELPVEASARRARTPS
jgi:hypothetical protein